MTADAVDVAGLREVWKPIRGFEGKYDVSSHGRVRSLSYRSGTVQERTRIEPMVMRQTEQKKGYLTVSLWLAGQHTYRKVHHLVLEAFSGPKPPDQQGAHLDGNPQNNHVANLRWVTPQENTNHAKAHGTVPTKIFGERNGSAKLTEGMVRSIRRLRREGYPYREIAEGMNVSETAVYEAATGMTWAHVQ